ncbi:MAG: hypothetical protein ACE364_04295 [Chlorobiota bacterium]
MKSIKNILFFLLGMTTMLLVAELFISKAKVIEYSLGQYYDDLGKGLPKNRTSLMFTEGFGIFHTNSDRYIGDRKSLKTPFRKRPVKDTIKIALIGDSFVESFQVFERNYFGRIAEKILNKKYPNYIINIQNFGRANFGLNHIYAYHQVFVNNFNPDLVLYFLSNGDVHKGPPTPLYPYCYLDNDSLIITTDYPQRDIEKYKRAEKWLSNSIVANLVNNARHTIRKQDMAAVFFGNVYNWFSEPKQERPILDSTYEVEPIIESIVSKVDENTILINRDKLPLYNKFTDVVNKNNVEYWSLYPVLDSAEKAGIRTNYWPVTNKTGHWNIQGHEIVGKELAKLLDERINKIISTSGN